MTILIRIKSVSVLRVPTEDFTIPTIGSTILAMTLVLVLIGECWLVKFTPNGSLTGSSWVFLNVFNVIVGTLLRFSLSMW